MLDLTLFSKIINWHKSSDHGGLFIPLPTKLAKQYPEDGRKGEDDSPTHITLLYIGEVPKSYVSKLLSVSTEVVSSTPSFKIELGEVSEFTNPKGQKIIHSTVKSPALHKLHNKLKRELETAGIPSDSKFPIYKPHITIEYVNDDKEAKYDDIKPKGSWNVDIVWVWGLDKPYPIFLK